REWGLAGTATCSCPNLPAPLFAWHSQPHITHAPSSSSLDMNRYDTDDSMPLTNQGSSETYAAESVESALPRGTRPDIRDIQRIIWLILAANVLTIIFVVIPVVVNLPDISSQPGWYGWDDVISLLEPMITLPMSLLILFKSGFFSGTKTDSRAQVGLLVFFAVAASIYQQGAGFHSAARMFKHPIQSFNTANPDLVTQYPQLNAIYVWMRTTWEHYIGHYMYAIGGVLVSLAQLYVYRNTRAPPFKSLTEKISWVLAVLTYGITIGGVAIQFPMGTLVALVLCVTIGFALCGGWLWKHGNFFWNREHLFFVQYLFYAYVIGFVITVGWISKYGLLARNEANGGTV
ncbi:uncharacterized protein BJ171DRAFT_255699, partial [Polychytrium aggregatum]|uniref:uncharacterized protein n=1 Tax=Polychytrium aggregatum TaxID=110093 RepID=UPI0022FE327A